MRVETIAPAAAQKSGGSRDSGAQTLHRAAELFDDLWAVVFSSAANQGHATGTARALSAMASRLGATPKSRA